MNYSGIIKDDIANGIGIRTSLFVSGCRNNCPGCFNKEAQDFNYGKHFTQSVIDEIIDSVKEDYYDGISILGGEPLEPENLKPVLELIKQFRNKYGDSKTIWLYTGYKYEDIVQSQRSIRFDIISQVDVLVDGPFIESLKDLNLKFRGSSNQNVIDIKSSKESNFQATVYLYK